MNKYNRRHGQSNTSKGIYWILFAGIIAVLVYKVVEFKRKIKETQEIEKQGTPNLAPHPVYIITDSSTIRDTSF